MESNRQPLWQLDAISKHSTDSIVIIDTDKRIRFATPSIENLFGFDPTNEKIHEFFDKVIYPDDMEFVHERYDHVVHETKPGFTDHRCIDRHGNIIYVECRTTPLEGSEDNLSITIIRDITAKKKMAFELERRKNRYVVLQNSLKQFSQDLTSVMKFTDLESRLKKEVDELLPGTNPTITSFYKHNQCVEAEGFQELAPYFRQLVTGKLEKTNSYYFISFGERDNHTYILVLETIDELENADIIWLETLVYYASLVLESLNVIENLMNMLASSVETNENTPLWILRLLFNLSEKERLNLSADLHDTVLQDQIVLDRSLKSLISQNSLQNRVKAQLQEIEQGFEDTIHQIRSICNELRPPFLMEHGLVSALENLFEYTQTYNSNYQIHFSYNQINSMQFDEERTVNMYRIVQELINNATKHSQASNLHIRLYIENGCLKFEYDDDGIGFELEQLKASHSNMGLMSIAQRIETLSGNIAFYSRPSQGLKVNISIPLNSDTAPFER